MLSERNAAFMQLVNSSLQSRKTSLSHVVTSLYKQQSNLLHLETISNSTAGGCMTAWQAHYVIRIPAERQDETHQSIRTGRDLLSSAMRYIFYGSSTELL